jgi:hypothetical protein
MKPTIPLLAAFLLALPTVIRGTEPAATTRLTGFPGTMSELAKPAKRSPRAPKYEDICFSPRTTAAGGLDVVEVAKGFHATRIEWLYVHEEDGPVLRKLRDLGISLGLAVTHPRDTTEHHSGPVGFPARPQYYTKGRVLDIDGRVLDGRSSMHDPATAELTKDNLRLCAKFGAERIQRDEPTWSYRDWDFNLHALSQFNAWLAARVPAPTLADLGVDDPARFDLKAYIRGQQDGKTVPPEFKTLWEDFRRETLLAWYQDLRRWTAEIVGPDVEWSANYSSFIQFTPERLWSDYAVTELQPSGGQFGIGDPWSLYRKAEISRKLGKALVVTLGSHDIEENKTMIGLTYAMGLHMLCPFAVYMKNKPRKFDDPKTYADVYDFVHRWGKRYLAGYEEAFALGNGIIHPLARHGVAPLVLEDAADSVYAFVRARPGQPDAPVVIHLVNWHRQARDPIAVTLDPDRFFPDRGLKLTLLHPGREPEVISDGFQARVELPSPAPLQIVIAEPASPSSPKVWAPEVDTESFRFFDRRHAALRSRTPGAVIHFTTDNSEPGVQSPRYERPIEITGDTTLKARAFSNGQASPVSVFRFGKQPANHLTAVSGAGPGLTYELRRGVKFSEEPDLDDPMKWAGGQYRFDTAKTGVTSRIELPAEAPRSMFAVVFDGLIEIPRDGLYTFFVNADDECRLDVDGRTVVNLTGRKIPPDVGMTELQGRRLLSKGLHKLRIEYLQMFHDSGLEVQWQGPGIDKQPIAATQLKHAPWQGER